MLSHIQLFITFHMSKLQPMSIIQPSGKIDNHDPYLAHSYIQFTSSDMLQRVYERRGQYNNDERLAQNAIWSTGKMM